LGYYAAGDGGLSHYGRVAAAPAQGGLQTSFDGAWWELASDGEVNIIQFGAKPDASFSTVWSGTECRNAIFNAQNYLVRKFGGGVVNIPAGTYYHFAGANSGAANTYITPASYITYRGAGRKNTTIVFDDTVSGAFSGYYPLFNYTSSQTARLQSVSFEDFTVRGILDTVVSSGVTPISMYKSDGVRYSGMGIEYSRSYGIYHNDCANLTVIDFYGYGSWLNMISTTSCSNMIVNGFYIYGSQSSAVTNDTVDTSSSPLRQGITVSNGIIEESAGLTFYGAKQLSLSNITMRRILTSGIFIGRPSTTYGGTSLHSITISNITISDLIRFAYSPTNDISPNPYFRLSSGWRTTAYATGGTYNKTYVGAPGRPDTSGAMVPLYGSGYGNFETNNTESVDQGAGGTGITISNIVLQRTLPSVSQASDWGFNTQGLFAPRYAGGSLYYNGTVDETMFTNYGFYIEPSLQNMVMSNAVVRGVGDYGMVIASAGAPSGVTKDIDNFGLDNVLLRSIRISDVNLACLTFQRTIATMDNITFRDCLFDGDPLLRSQARGGTHKAEWLMKAAFTASISGTTMTVTTVTSGSLVPGQFLFGLTISGSVQISSQSSGTPGGVGTYIVSTSQSVSNKSLAAVPPVTSSFTGSYASNILTVTAISSGAIVPGQVIYAPGTSLGNVHIISQIPGGTPGGVGTYNIDSSGTQASAAFVGWIGNGPVGADISLCSGFRFIGCQFRNVVQPIVESSLRPNFKQDNIILGRPVAFGFSPSSQGVAYCPNLGDEFSIIWEDSDPANYQTFGVTLDSGLSVSAAMPTSGYYAPGEFVSVQTPVISSGRVLSGWRRLTWSNSTASNHVDGVDWAQQFIATS
jgi:hypothetical protein